MAVALEHRLALLGGGFSTGDDGLLDDWVLGQVRAPRPKVCFVPTASGDAPAYVDRFLAAFRPRSCEPGILHLFRRELDDDALRTFLLSQDVIYVGGGNTVNLLAVWRAHGVDRLLHEAFDRGTLLCGISAGVNCWAEGSHTDSFGPLTRLSDGLGLLAGSVCPHYDSEPGRRSSYQAAVATRALPAGWAVEDGVGALFTDGRLTGAVTRTTQARLYRVEPGEDTDEGGRVAEQPCRAVCSPGQHSGPPPPRTGGPADGGSVLASYDRRPPLSPALASRVAVERGAHAGAYALSAHTVRRRPAGLGRLGGSGRLLGFRGHGGSSSFASSTWDRTVRVSGSTSSPSTVTESPPNIARNVPLPPAAVGA
ncbi:Type 1 glutamine amidotransferase-like domain-containing protein [Streptomyces sp. V3I7]|uniref:Type 1 glutamine amidotransferase-like domain-containing protein n=1 Tax=Streptomyces sp. V3I7 TaxID=3042278 RepID=UPI00278B2DC6|nr:dipeptidase E [Streptomyces sp. V3I7]